MILAETIPSPAAPVSALMLSDRLITLAKAADSAGLRSTATRLVRLAHTVLEEPERNVRN